ncbi:hypothetical protein ACH5RR_025081 [Cinchona calisaya]|uniref:NIN-like protein n=1 Tax=Cinchona calisaya TaxID=153742 RepID=A0ABD2Z153_9GENT
MASVVEEEEEEESRSSIDLNNLNGHFSIQDFLDYLGGAKLRFSERTSPKNFTVFSNPEEEEDDSHRPPTVKSKIGAALESIDFWHLWAILAQFWTPVRVGNGSRLLLKTTDQPFGMTNLLRGLCSYRKFCLSYSYVAYGDEDAGEEQEQEQEQEPEFRRQVKGPPSRVFLTGLPEYSPNIEFYSTEEFPMKDDAISRQIRYYLAVPVFGPGSHDCIGVLELLWRPYDPFHMYKLAYLVGLVSSALEEEELRTSDYNCHFDMENDLANSSTGFRHAFSKIQKALTMVCKRHKLPFAQTWTPSSDENYIGKVMSTTKKGSYLSDRKYSLLKEACMNLQLMKGQGVVWRALLCQNSCFCKDTSQLKITDYSFSHVAKILGLTSSFAICLQSNHTGDDIYVLELFLPNYKTRDPQILLDTLLSTLKQHLKSFKIISGQKLGKELYVEVLRVSEEDDELDSFVICRTAGSGSLGLEAQGSKDDSMLNQHFLSRQPSIFDRLQDVEGLLMEDDDINIGGNILDPEEGGNSDTQVGKKSRHSVLEFDEIDRNVLEKYSAMRLIDAARHLNMSRSTFKRKCRKNGIPSWRPKRNKGTTSNKSIHDHEKHITEHGLQQGSSPGKFAAEGTTSNPCRLPESSTSSIMTIKAEYGEEDVIKFGLPFSSTMTDLEKEVTSRLKLEMGSIKIRYKDEDDEWILVTLDNDLRAMESMGKTIVRLKIDSKSSSK